MAGLDSSNFDHHSRICSNDTCRLLKPPPSSSSLVGVPYFSFICIFLGICTTTSSFVFPKNPSFATTTTTTTTMSKKGLFASSSRRILCYGDSLTAGTVSSDYQLYPYAPFLEKTLNQNISDNESSSFVVRHRGLPGWTSSQMLEAADDAMAGLRSAIQAVSNPPLSTVIILAGTNDLGWMTSPTNIVQNLKALHEMAWELKVPHTVAIAVPPSGYQSSNSKAADLANEINMGLQQFCQENKDKATYFSFPFGYERGGSNWSPDGLHFSPQGYETLGESLAPIVIDIYKNKNH